MTEDATLEDVKLALASVMGAHGHKMDSGRIKTVTMIVLNQGWKKAELEAATRALASSPALRDNLRYGLSITPADFEQVRTGGANTVGEERREVVTMSGSVLRVRRARLYTHTEAFALWQRMGEPGRFSDSRTVQYPDSAFEVVVVNRDDGESVGFRLKDTLNR